MRIVSRRSNRIVGRICGLLTIAALAFAALAQPTTRPSQDAAVDLSKDRTLYVVPYAHLDTQWRWAYPQVIREFIPNTLHQNFALFEKYPSYVFNFSGSRRYEMTKEYYPQDYQTLQRYISQGRWFPCGSSVDENDCNVPSAESHVRHVLYGNQYFRREFGVESVEFMLPDCFGFTAALPSMLAHCGIRGFSTQKLTWGSAVGIPFKIGVWEGPDGQSVIAALDPGSYAGGVKEDLSHNESWLKRIETTGKSSGVYADYHYYGTGDKGGAPDEASVQWMEKSVAGDGPIRVLSTTAERMFKDITDQQRQQLPKFTGELLLTEHSAGSVTSQAYMKRWNRSNELLADAAERAAVAALWLGGAPYPGKKLYDAWVLVLGTQMHDMLPGTSIPKAYEFCWNDLILAANQLAAVVEDSVGVVASQMDTQASGVPLVVYNPLSIERQDVVDATVIFPGAAPEAIAVFGPDGKPVRSQILDREGDRARILFLARAPSVGFVTYDVRPATAGAQLAAADSSDLRVDEGSLENALLRVKLSSDGDIASIFDKHNNREVLSAPSRLALLYENPAQFPAWNMDWSDRQKPPRAHVAGPAKVRVIESGPVRVSVEVVREAEGSRFVQCIRLAAGAAGDRVEVANTIDWQTRERSLKATFPFTVSNPLATYDIAVGTIQRGNNDEKKFEVPQHQWFDLSDPAGEYGVAVLNDCKYGSDKPDDNTLRLTLLYTPGVRGGYRDQAIQDIGRHDMVYAVAPHAGDWRQGRVPAMAARLNQPLLSFQTASHAGALGRSFSLIKLNTDQVAVTAIKKAEESNEIIVRLKELTGNPATGVRLTAAAPIQVAREVNGQEQYIGAARLEGGALAVDVEPYRLRAFALKLGAAPAQAPPPQAQALALPHDLDVMSHPANRDDGAFDSDGRTYAADQIPRRIIREGIEFVMGPTGDGQKNALACRGQTIPLPPGFQRVYILAAAADGDQSARFTIGDRRIDQTIPNWSGYIAQWDNRLWKGPVAEESFSVNNEWDGLVPGYVKRDTVAWFCSHRHHPSAGNEFYQYSYLFKFGFDVPDGATALVLPRNDKVRIFAVTVANYAHDDVRAARPLYDTLEDRTDPALAPRPSIAPGEGKFNDSMLVSLNHPLYWKSGGLRYTLDGSEPTGESPVYSKPILLHETAKIRARQFHGDVPAGPEVVATIEVNDITPPLVQSAAAVAVVPAVTVSFSEPLGKAAAQLPANYQFDPPAKVESAELTEDGRTVLLKLAQPLGDSLKHRLVLRDLTDASPAANRIASDPVPVSVAAPVYSRASVVCAGEVQQETVADLPVKAKDPWTMNFFVRTDQTPENRTLLAGFGRIDNQEAGCGRYLSKFGNGVHFWSHRRDVDTRTPLDVGPWQMLSATYDGQRLRVYKNAELIGERDVELADDEPVVRFAAVRQRPGGRGTTAPAGAAAPTARRFVGEIRAFTVWNTPLSSEALLALLNSMPPGGDADAPGGSAERLK